MIESLFGRERIPPALLRSILVVVVAAALGGAASLVVSRTIAPEYRATAQLYISPASTATGAFQEIVLGPSLARSYTQLATAEVVLRPAMERVGGQDLRAFRQRTEILQAREVPLINVSHRANDPELAAAAANAIADSFIVQSRNLQSALLGSVATQLEDQIGRAQDDIRALETQLGVLTTENTTSPRPDLQAQILQLDAARQTAQQTLSQLLRTRDDMRLMTARAENTVSLWQPATRPLEPESPRVLLNTGIGALAAALLAMLAVVLLRRLDDRITDFDRVRARLGIAPLGEIGRAARSRSTGTALVLRDDPSSLQAEAFRALRTNVLFANVDRRPKTILVTSARPAEGKSIVSANLALAFAQAATTTVLVDADLRRPSLHRLFGLRMNRGLTSLLLGDDIALPEVLDLFKMSEHLYVIPSGPLPPNTAELLSSSKMSGLMAQLAGLDADATVIIDASPVLAVADPVALATKVDGCLLVVDSTRISSKPARLAVDALRRVRAPILGAVLNKVSFQHSTYEQYQAAPEEEPTHLTRASELRRSQPRRRRSDSFLR
ncbi:MAG: polysaccharide biosynthesis tyrosine autokinase [Candidatus Limnocylindria bacterium]